MSEWPIRSLRDAGVILIDCVHATPKAQDDGYPYVAIPQMKNGHIDFTEARRISQADLHEWTKKARPQKYDVVLSRRTNPGVIAVDRSGMDFALGQNLVLLRADGKTVLPQFLRWLATGPYWWEQIGKFMNVGAVFDSLRCADVPQFELPIPPKDEQRAISALLDDLDDKIELNRRTNETLEAMAQAIFHDWFVDFGPTSRKIDGATDPVEIMGGLVNDPDRARQMADLFPTRMDDGVPRGWAEKPIGDLADVAGGSTPSTASPEYWDRGHHLWATPKDLSRLDGMFLFDTERRITDRGLAKIGSGLSPKGTVLLSSRAPIGYLAIADKPTAVNQGFIALRPTQSMPTSLALCWCRENMDLIKSHANGSTFQEISKKNFRPLPVVVGGKAITAEFDNMIAPLFALIRTRSQEAGTLAAIRGLLLPKLMSGEIRLGEAPRQLEAAQ
ncbi:restriction endonuclease subunit S [Mesorhizobium sp. ESP-6-2]|uniref:restriction endonuclease subunit S n=1 Tax=Mesorhizobium sp. ESP-6-2 TaxID=2876625 RepID=UPI001CCC9588|nr:restriction endonuclease subunit S [Mesorhizobium sp. ESP-6-2]MBZ9810721.1 restriction endonuclease subunit S [Mesorhizobium sp. ESP-6-2]